MNDLTKNSIKKIARIKSAHQKKFTDEDLDIAIEWIKGNINYTQISKYKKIKMSSPIYVYLASALRIAYQQGLIQIT